MPPHPPRRAGAPAAALERLRASDPGLSRLRVAVRVTATLALVALALAALHAALVPLPPIAIATALTLAIQGALQIRDATARGRRLTRLLAAGLGLAALAVLSLLHARPALCDLLFLAVAFAAVLARRWGPRWNAAGMFAFMSAFLGAYFRPEPAALPAVALALATSALLAHLVREHLLPDRPAADLRRTLTALDGRIGLAVSALRRGERLGWTAERRRAAAARAQRVKDALLLAEGVLPPVEEADGEGRMARTTRLSVQLFDLQLALETAFAAALGDRRTRDEERRRRLAGALDRLARLRLESRRTARDLRDEDFEGGAKAPGAPAARAVPLRLDDPSARLALQVTLACALAMAGGYVVSAERWFWAVLTAFLVFVNTQSRGDALLRGLARALGTAGGVVAGVALATLLAGHPVAALAFTAACVFTGFYLVQLSYGALTFFVTVALSLIYGLLGDFSPALLVLRLEETLVGAAAGMTVSFFVLPTRTAQAVGRASDDFLRDLDRLLQAHEALRRGEGSPWRVLAVVRALDRRHGEIVAALRPLGSGWLAPARRRAVRLGLLRFTVLAYWAHRLAAAAQGSPPPGPPAEADAGAIEACRRLIGLCRGRDLFDPAAPAPEPAPAPVQGAGDAALAIHAIAHVLRQIAPREAAPQGSRESVDKPAGV